MVTESSNSKKSKSRASRIAAGVRCSGGRVDQALERGLSFAEDLVDVL